MRECKHCGDEFNPKSRAKQLAGGYANECPNCVEARGGDDSPPKYLACAAGDGKSAGITILKFDTDEDREAYSKAWLNNAGMHKGKSCQLGSHLTPMSGIKFKTVQKMENLNHKGRA